MKTATAIANMLTLPRGTTVVPESRMYSVFAPVGVTGLDLTQDIDKLDSVRHVSVSYCLEDSYNSLHLSFSVCNVPTTFDITFFFVPVPLYINQLASVATQVTSCNCCILVWIIIKRARDVDMASTRPETVI